MPKIKIYIIIICCLSLMACSEQKSEYFNNANEAQHSATAKGGWIPDWLPANATEIHIQYDLDTNYRWIKFKLEKSLKDDFITNFEKISWEKAKDISTSSPRGAKWWFQGLIQQQPANDAALNAELYIGNGIKIPKSVYLAVSRTDDSIYLWIGRS